MVNCFVGPAEDAGTPLSTAQNGNSGADRGSGELTLDLGDVLPSPYQPRQRRITKQDVEELLASIAAVGQLQPIIVTQVAEQPGKYHVHAGHRRCAALRFLDRPTVQAVVRELSDRDARKLALCENLGREDLTCSEQADALERYANDFDLSVNAAARELGISESTTKRLRLIINAPEQLRQLLHRNVVGTRAAELLARIEKERPGIGIRKGQQFAENKLDTAALQRELGELRASRRQRQRRPGTENVVKCDIGEDELEVRIRLGTLSREDPVVKQAIDAALQCLQALGFDAAMTLSEVRDRQLLHANPE